MVEFRGGFHKGVVETGFISYKAREGRITMSKDRVIDILKESLSSEEIAREVGVSKRCVDYWVSGKEKPGTVNKRKLFDIETELIAEGKIPGGNVEEKKKKVVYGDEPGQTEMVDPTPEEIFKADLDVIDVEFTKGLADPFYDVAFAVQIVMWDKGKVISERVGGVSEPEKINWSDLSKQTGRSDKSLKKWYVLFKNTPDRGKFEEIAKKTAQTQTDRWIKGIEAAALPSGKEKEALAGSESEPKEITPRESMLKCLAEHYDSKDAMWSQVEDCNKCPMLTLCRQLGEIIDKDPRFRKIKEG